MKNQSNRPKVGGKNRFITRPYHVIEEKQVKLLIGVFVFSEHLYIPCES